MGHSHRQWLNTDKAQTSFVAASIDKWEACLTLADCNRQVTIHSGTITHHSKDKVSKNVLNAYMRKLMVIRDAIDFLLNECDVMKLD